jgi:hypothetical protein
MVDWVALVREIRLLLTELESHKFYALYGLTALVLVGYIVLEFIGKGH